MQLVTSKRNETLSLPCKEIDADSAKHMGSPLAQKILNKLAVKPTYPSELAEQLRIHEQKVYYHIRKLEKAGLIKQIKQENKQGAIAQYFALTQPCFAVRFKEFMGAKKISFPSNESQFLEPFIVDGELNALIIVGSPDPHGPEKARSRDGYYGMDLALFLGTFLNYISGLSVRLDTEVRDEDLKNNLIILGGPIVNSVMSKINDKLPVKFTQKSILSTISEKEYFEDETGIIVKMKNPFDKTKEILVVAGRRHSGTRACIIAFQKHFKEVKSGNNFNKNINAKIVEGIDLDSDGVVDDIEVKE